MTDETERHNERSSRLVDETLDQLERELGDRTALKLAEALARRGAASRGDLKAVARAAREARFAEARARCRLRELPVAALLPGIERQAIPLFAINEETGHANHAEMLYVLAIARQIEARRIFEFGTFLGRTTYHFASSGPDVEVFTLDLPQDCNPWSFAAFVGAIYREMPPLGRIHEIREDAATFDPAPLSGTMDLVWVDGDHSYDAVRNDTEKALRLVRPGGMVLWHDFGPESPGLVDFFAEFTANRPLFRLRNTSVLLHWDGVDPLGFSPHAVPFSKALFKGKKAAKPVSKN